MGGAGCAHQVRLSTPSAASSSSSTLDTSATFAPHPHDAILKIPSRAERANRIVRRFGPSAPYSLYCIESSLRQVSADRRGIRAAEAHARHGDVSSYRPFAHRWPTPSDGEPLPQRHRVITLAHRTRVTVVLSTRQPRFGDCLASLQDSQRVILGSRAEQPPARQRPGALVLSWMLPATRKPQRCILESSYPRFEDALGPL